jgi:cobalt-zinc-cadmium efflux system membrane fusion protein
MTKFLPLLLLSTALLPAADPSNTVVLTAEGVKNLRIETVLVEEADFEETIFALGRIEVYPGRRAVISSRVPGRALEVFVKHDHAIQKGDPAVIVESRQPGDPPPRITVTAPISGLVSATHIVPGEPVSPDKPLAEILDLTEVYAIARVPEHLAGKLQPGQPAHITVAAAPGRVFEARLEHLGAQADSESGTVEAAFHVDNPGLVLRPGMRAEFSIVVDRRPNIVSVPRSALQGDPSNRFVYVKDFDLPNAFVKSPVVVGRINDRSAEILSGLLPADEVVTRGAYSLAFASAGSISLKEALDAAHGHEHNEDGSEITADQKKAAAAAPDAAPRPALFWPLVSGVLLVLLIATNLGRFRRAE